MLTLPEVERQWARKLEGAWQDFLYVPGSEFVSPLDPGLYRASFVVVLDGGVLIRITSSVVTAHGELCRLRLERVAGVRLERLGSFFDPSRRGMLWGGRDGGALSLADRPGWSYEGPSLASHLGRVSRVGLLRERVSGQFQGRSFAWVADRGLVLIGTHGRESLLLAEPDVGEHAAFLPAVGAHRALLDPGHPATPGASLVDLLGHGDREGVSAVSVDVESPV